MKKAQFLNLLVVIFATSSALADDIAPGLWEISMESTVPSDAGWTPSSFNLTQCLTASDAKDPSRLIASMAVPGATGCQYTDKSYSGGNFRFALDCSGSFGLKVKGSVAFSTSTFNGAMTATGIVIGSQPTVFQNQVSGKRIGGC